MKTRKMLLAAIAATTLAAAVPAFAEVGLWVNVAPPAPPAEVVPAPRPGFVWAPGYYDYRHGRYVWVRGHWERERHGMYWHPSHWVEHDGRWTLEHGRWDRERYVDNDRHEWREHRREEWREHHDDDRR